MPTRRLANKQLSDLGQRANSLIPPAARQPRSITCTAATTG